MASKCVYSILAIVIACCESKKRFVPTSVDEHKSVQKILGLFPVSASKSDDIIRDKDQVSDNRCPYFMSDGWYMMLAMDFAIQTINRHGSYDFKLEPIKLDTCSMGNEDYWVDEYHRLLLSENITGIVGASYSSNSKIAAHLSTALEIPMITYQSSALSISDTVYFPYLFRTIPIDDLQAKALKHLLMEMNLMYIALFYDPSPYGQGLMEMMMKSTGEHFEDQICLLEGGYKIRQDKTYDYKGEIDMIKKNDMIKAIAVFGFPEDINKIKDSFRKYKKNVDDYIWIASDGWAQFDSSPGLSKVVGTTFSANVLDGFSTFYNQKIIELTHKRSTYLEDDQTYRMFEKFKTDKGFMDQMTRITDEKITYITPVVEAVFAFAEVLSNTSKSETISEQLMELTYNVSKVFKIRPSKCCRMAMGTEKLTYGSDSYGAYAYLAYSYGDQNKTWVIGSWHNEGAQSIYIDQKELKLLVASWNMTQTSSECAKCQDGQIRDMSSRECCKGCTSCNSSYQYTDHNHLVCFNCSQEARAWENHTGCEEILPVHFVYTNSVELSILVFSCLGVICVGTTYWYMYIYTYTPIARASGREYMLLVTICTCLCFISPFVLFGAPSEFVCKVQRVIVAGPTVGIIAACLVRTFSIDRIFRQPGVRQRLLSKRLVLMIIGFLIVIEVFIECIIMVAMPSGPRNHTTLPHAERTLECTMPNEDILLTFIFPGMLVCLCFVFALRIRKVPSNYNESRYIIFTILILVFESATFFMIYKNLSYMLYIRYSVGCVVIGTYMTYFCLFLPRLYIILFKPERNTLQLQCATSPQFDLKTVDKGCNTSLHLHDRFELSNGKVAHQDTDSAEREPLGFEVTRQVSEEL